MTAPMSVTEALKHLKAAVSNAHNVVLGVDQNDLNTLLKAFKLIANHKKEIDDIADNIGTLHKKLQTETVPQALEALGFDSVKLGGYNYILSARLFANIPVDRKDEGFEWLHSVGLENLIVPTVNPKSLSSAIKAFEEDKGESPPDCITVHRQKYVQVRKA